MIFMAVFYKFYKWTICRRYNISKLLFRNLHTWFHFSCLVDLADDHYYICRMALKYKENICKIDNKYKSLVVTTSPHHKYHKSS